MSSAECLDGGSGGGYGSDRGGDRYSGDSGDDGSYRGDDRYGLDRSGPS